MTFEEKWNHVARRLFVFFTREGVFNFSQLLLSPLGRMYFASNASKRRERFLFFKRLRAFILLALQTSIVLTSISFRQATFPKGESKERRFTCFIGRACPKGESKKWISPFHRESLPQRGKQEMDFPVSSGEPAPKGKARDGDLPVSSGEPAPKGKARNGDLPVLSGEFTSNVKASLEK